MEGTIFLPIINNGQQTITNTATTNTISNTTDLTNTIAYSSEPIPGQYIVVFKPDLVVASSVTAIAAEMVAQYGGEIVQSYDSAISGFAASFPGEVTAAAASGLQQDPRVAYVEQDSTIGLQPLNTQPTVTEADLSTVEAAASNTVQTGATWGLDRLDQRALPLNGTYSYGPNGTGVSVYIIDTGINVAHSQFGGRASLGYSTVGGTAADCNGHGTHVAGTVGGATYGVAKGVTLIAVRVLGCTGSGTLSGVMAGVDWVAKQKLANPSRPMVANMSLGGSRSSALESAVRNSIQAGVTYAIAAGNDNGSACTVSPAAVPEAITVGATTNSDARASFSNYGTCVDIFAPGVNITSAWYTSSTATNTISGTSMATPHVAGVAALYLQRNPTASPATVSSALRTQATPNKVLNPGAGSPNFLLFSNPY
ncbi:MAG: S8 family peptidase [Chloroflexi bacterium]|nr:S8 family peptidase [Chloroflexota bacterium]